MHLCPDEVVAALAAITAGPLLVYRYVRHQLGCLCRWCARIVRH